MILFTTKSATNGRNSLLDLLAILGEYDVVTSTYTKYSHLDKDLTILKLSEYNRAEVKSQLSKFDNINIIRDYNSSSDVLTIVLDTLNKYEFTLKVGVHASAFVTYCDKGLCFKDGGLLLWEDVCHTNIMGKLPEDIDINRIVAAYYKVHYSM